MSRPLAQCPQCGFVLRAPNRDSNEAFAYEAAAAGRTFRWIAEHLRLIHNSTARNYAKRYAARYGLPWPPQPLPTNDVGDDDHETVD